MKSIESLNWPAPAKLNLFLHITGRREDGYHELQTVFQLLDLGDRLDFRLREDDRVTRRGAPVGIAETDDLTVRAARLLQRETGHRGGADVRLQKRLPVGGGVGGGSSDAATVLVALNELWCLELCEDDLADLGRRLGADVPVFVRGRSAWAEGVGERLTPLPLGNRWYVVIAPGVEVSTKAVFSDPELTRNSTPIKISGFRSGGVRNDCEPVVRKRYPAVARALDWLGEFAQAHLTGTGSCIFAALSSEARAREVLARMPLGWTGFTARGVDHSPLLDRLAAERTARRRAAHE